MLMFPNKSMNLLMTITCKTAPCSTVAQLRTFYILRCTQQIF